MQLFKIQANLKTLKFATFELPQDFKCVEKMTAVRTDTDEKLLQGTVKIT